MENINEEMIKYLKKKSKRLESQIKALRNYVELIDDRNSLKIQTIKSDMQKILKKEK